MMDEEVVLETMNEHYYLEVVSTRDSFDLTIVSLPTEATPNVKYSLSFKIKSVPQLLCFGTGIELLQLMVNPDNFDIDLQSLTLTFNWIILAEEFELNQTCPLQLTKVELDRKDFLELEVKILKKKIAESTHPKPYKPVVTKEGKNPNKLQLQNQTKSESESESESESWDLEKEREERNERKGKGKGGENKRREYPHQKDTRMPRITRTKDELPEHEEKERNEVNQNFSRKELLKTEKNMDAKQKDEENKPVPVIKQKPKLQFKTRSSSGKAETKEDSYKDESSEEPDDYRHKQQSSSSQNDSSKKKEKNKQKNKVNEDRKKSMKELSMKELGMKELSMKELSMKELSMKEIKFEEKNKKMEDKKKCKLGAVKIQDSKRVNCEQSNQEVDDPNFKKILVGDKVRIDFKNGGFYFGEVLGNQYHGKGYCQSKDFGVYNGNWKLGKRHGYGDFEDLDKNKYNGEFKEDKKHGRGSEQFSNGEKYEGQFNDDYREGFGSYYFANGDSYVGEWRKDMWHGKGREIFADESFYEGCWQNDKRQGKGIFQNPEGQQFEQTYRDGVLLNEQPKLNK